MMRCYSHRFFCSFETETALEKKVEDVMPIATGHEREELEAELEVILCLLILSPFFFLF